MTNIFSFNLPDVNSILIFLDEYFHCRIPAIKSQKIKEEYGDEECSPVILCEIHDPYNSTDSLLKRSQCGYDNISFW